MELTQNSFNDVSPFSNYACVHVYQFALRTRRLRQHLNKQRFQRDWPSLIPAVQRNYTTELSDTKHRQAYKAACIGQASILSGSTTAAKLMQVHEHAAARMRLLSVVLWSDHVYK